MGRDARAALPLEHMAEWDERDDRADPLRLLLDQCAPRVPELVPIKFGRMMASPFAYYRGSPIVMAHDLAQFPHTNLMVQAAGDAHLLNFGGFATPERNLIFDVNDFDETHTGPWEWDVKRLAASVVVAGGDIGLGADDRRRAAHAAAASYAMRINEYAEMANLDIWYSRVDTETAEAVLRQTVASDLAESVRKEIEKGVRRAQASHQS